MDPASYDQPFRSCERRRAGARIRARFRADRALDAHAAIDVSDGFAQDLGHILEASGVGAEVRYALLPKHRIADPALERRCVLSGGDDYELVFTAPPAQRAAIERLSGEPRLTRVGAIFAGAATLRVLDERGASIAVERGYDHFAA